MFVTFNQWSFFYFHIVDFTCCVCLCDFGPMDLLTNAPVLLTLVWFYREGAIVVLCNSCEPDPVLIYTLHTDTDDVPPKKNTCRRPKNCDVTYFLLTADVD